MTVCDICKGSAETATAKVTISYQGTESLHEYGEVDLCGECQKLATPDAFRAGLVSLRRKTNRKPKKEAESITVTGVSGLEFPKQPPADSAVTAGVMNGDEFENF